MVNKSGQNGLTRNRTKLVNKGSGQNWLKRNRIKLVYKSRKDFVKKKVRYKIELLNKEQDKTGEEETRYKGKSINRK
jgi:hypothetical protein